VNGNQCNEYALSRVPRPASFAALIAACVSRDRSMDDPLRFRPLRPLAEWKGKALAGWLSLAARRLTDVLQAAS